MKLTSKDALKLLDEAEKQAKCNGWIIHSKCVGDPSLTVLEKKSH